MRRWQQGRVHGRMRGCTQDSKDGEGQKGCAFHKRLLLEYQALGQRWTKRSGEVIDTTETRGQTWDQTKAGRTHKLSRAIANYGWPTRNEKMVPAQWGQSVGEVAHMSIHACKPWRGNGSA